MFNVITPQKRLKDLLHGKMLVGIGFIIDVHIKVKDLVVEIANWDSCNGAVILVIVEEYQMLVIVKCDDCGDATEGELDMGNIVRRILKQVGEQLAKQACCLVAILMPMVWVEICSLFDTVIMLVG